MSSVVVAAGDRSAGDLPGRQDSAGVRRDAAAILWGVVTVCNFEQTTITDDLHNDLTKKMSGRPDRFY